VNGDIPGATFRIAGARAEGIMRRETASTLSMPSAPIRVTPEAARRFIRRALLLDAPAPDVASALAHHGYVQIDPINICGRMHDLILRNRVAGYREGGLHEYIHGGSRPGFEHYLPGAGVLAALPVSAWPHVFDRAHRRRSNSRGYYGKLSVSEERLAERILGDLAERGPLTSDDIDHDARSMTAWGTDGRMAKTVLEKLFAHARVLITRRRGFRRVYDLPERVLPASVLSTAPVAAELTARWVVESRLRQRRLAALRKADLLLVEDLVQPVEVEGCPLLHCLREDVPLFERGQALNSEMHRFGSFQNSGPDPFKAPLLLAPLDPLIYDRRLARSLWGFDYIWEAYTPAAKRKRGYYALPVLSGTAIVGHVDPRADREKGKLVIVSRRVRRGHKVAGAVKDLAAFLKMRV
jgi:uncharacterized protein YcaQ